MQRAACPFPGCGIWRLSAVWRSGSALGITELLAIGKLLEIAQKARQYEDPDSTSLPAGGPGERGSASARQKASGHHAQDPDNSEDLVNGDDSLTALFRTLDPVSSCPARSALHPFRG